MEIQIAIVVLVLIELGILLVLMRQSFVLIRLVCMMGDDLTKQEIKLIEMDCTLDLIYYSLPDD